MHSGVFLAVASGHGSTSGSAPSTAPSPTGASDGYSTSRSIGSSGGLLDSISPAPFSVALPPTSPIQFIRTSLIEYMKNTARTIRIVTIDEDQTAINLSKHTMNITGNLMIDAKAVRGSLQYVYDESTTRMDLTQFTHLLNFIIQWCDDSTLRTHLLNQSAKIFRALIHFISTDGITYTGTNKKTDWATGTPGDHITFEATGNGITATYKSNNRPYSLDDLPKPQAADSIFMLRSLRNDLIHNFDLTAPIAEIQDGTYFTQVAITQLRYHLYEIIKIIADFPEHYGNIFNVSREFWTL